MKQIQIGQFDPARLLTYLLSRLVDAHSAEVATRESGSGRIGDKHNQLPYASTRVGKSSKLPKGAGRRAIIKLEQ
jgi:hypothetical protein